MKRMDALILGAGKGTRMQSNNPKVLQTLLGESMIGIVAGVLNEVPAVHGLYAVVGHKAAAVVDELDRISKNLSREITWIEQKQQLGTGHALITAMPKLKEASHLLVVNGDAPLITAEILEAFISKAQDADIAFLSLELEDAGRYGRVMRNGGKVTAIVEAKDFDQGRYGLLADAHEVNSGIYLLSMEAVNNLLPELTNANNSGEYYITDLVSLGVRHGRDVRGICVGNIEGEGSALLGVNTPAELSAAEKMLQERRNNKLLEQGVILHASELMRIGPFAHIAPGAELFGPAEIYGMTEVEKGAVVRSHCVIKNAVVHEDAEVREFCHIEGAEIFPKAIVGPFARLRTGTVIEENAHVGDFVELKKTRLGKGSKANHLSYLGDSSIGENVNIGAGTITCNYDGTHKFQTEIGDRSFIGSNSALVAPVHVGRDTLIGAGSVITEDVPDGMLALGRGRQVNKDHKR